MTEKLKRVERQYVLSDSTVNEYGLQAARYWRGLQLIFILCGTVCGTVFSGYF